MSKEPIHSGHFMTSNPHTEIHQDDEDEDVEVDVVDVDEGVSTAPLDKTAAKEKDAEKPVTFYKFGPQKTQSIAIDVSLNKLNKCIRVAYMKMTTPKWKDFKGIKLQWKHRIRLNNVIWRAYYMEFRKPGRKHRSPYCYFSVPDDDMTHAKIEGSILEGMYWKRRMEGVCAQYKRWRTYFSKRKRCCRRRGHSCSCDVSTSTHHLNENSSHHSQLLLNNQQFMRSMTPDNLTTMAAECFLGTLFDLDDDMENEFTNQLFEQLNAPFLFPNPKEGASIQCDNADILQPGLLSLQPSIEEIMSTDYPFGGSSSSEYSNQQQISPQIESYPTNNLSENNGGRSSTTTTRINVQQMTNNENNNLSPSLLQQSQYSAREYDAANMLINYSSQAQHLNDNLTNQQQLSSCLKRQQQNHHNQRLEEMSKMSCNNNQQSFIEIQSAMPQVLTPPNCSNPLYSQAAVYETQRIALESGGARQKMLNNFEILEKQEGKIDGKFVGGSCTKNNIIYNNNLPPTPMSKIANQTCTTHQIITSVASSSHHPSHFSSPINYSLLAAASNSSNNCGQFNNNKQTNLIEQWHWNSQQQQAVYPQPFLHQQNVSSTANLLRKSSGNSVVPLQQQNSNNISSSSIRNFSTQSLLSSSSSFLNSSSLPSTRSLSFTSINNSSSSSPFISNNNKQLLNESSSVLSTHLLNNNKCLIEKSMDNNNKLDSSSNNEQLLQCLTEANNNNNVSIVPQSTIKQFVMSDLSRYLTQQTPIIANSSQLIQGNETLITNLTGFGQQNNNIIPTINLNKNNNNCLINSLQQNSSSIDCGGQQQYSPPSNSAPSLSLPLQINNESIRTGRGKGQKQQQQISPNSTSNNNNCCISSSSPPINSQQQQLPRKMSVSISSAFSSPTNFNNNLKKGRGQSFSSSTSCSTTSTINNNQQQHLGKRQISQQQKHQNILLSPPQKQQILMLNNNGGVVENNNNSIFIDEPEFDTIGGPIEIQQQQKQQFKQQQKWSNNKNKRKNNCQQQQMLAQNTSCSSSLSPPIIIPQQQQQQQCFNNNNKYSSASSPLNEATILLNSLIENKCNNNLIIEEELKQHKLLELGHFKQQQQSSNLEIKKENGGMDNIDRKASSATTMNSPFSLNNNGRIQEINNSSSPYFSSSSTTILNTNDEVSDICTNSAAADSTLNPDERKRILHLYAEKNRRSALKEGFDCLVKSIPVIEQAGLKSTNAVVLNRAAQHIKNLKLEQEQQLNQLKAFKEKITCMNERIALIQSNLPSSNLSGSKSNDNNSPTIRIQVEQFFERYKKDKSQEDCRFWLMCEVLKPIVYSFAEQIYPDASNRERILLSGRKWLDTHWNSAILRPIASDTLVRLATSGGAFTNKKALNSYISQQINQEVLPCNSSSSPSLSSTKSSFVRKK